jgi:hypothetical protein
MNLYIDRPENITDSVYIHMIYLKRYEEGHCVRDCMDLQLPMPSVPITTIVVSSNG